mmetsp:Transcript_115093/g.229212  ORF Transcript_115093/g.229212 Transcript_115093/m.229212 type:complete len:283 (+) Transcript_115093:109-957(+)
MQASYSEPDLALRSNRSSRYSSASSYGRHRKSANRVATNGGTGHANGPLDVGIPANVRAAAMGSSHSSGGRSRGSRRGKSVAMTLQEMQRKVQDEAMERHIVALGRDAKEAAVEKVTWDGTIRSVQTSEQQELLDRREQCRRNQLELKEQMEANKARRVEMRKEQIEAASTHSFPLFTETFVCEAEVEAYRKKQKEQWREELDEQRLTNQMLRNLEEKKHHDSAKQKHHENVASVIKERGHERNRLQQQGRELVNSWDRAVRLNGIKKAIHTGKDVAPLAAT